MPRQMKGACSVNADVVLALWNVLLCIAILYAPSLICGKIFLKAVSEKKKHIAALTGALTVAFAVGSSFILYHIVGFITSL